MAIMAIIISMKIHVFPCFVPENRSCLEQLSRSSQQKWKIYHRWTRETLLFLPSCLSCLKIWKFLKVKITISGTKQGFPVAEEISPNWWCGCVKPSWEPNALFSGRLFARGPLEEALTTTTGGSLQGWWHYHRSHQKIDDWVGTPREVAAEVEGRGP